jgi:hypothetical protein
MQNAKLGLSEEEHRLVSDAGVILTKNAIIAKVYDLFGELAQAQVDAALPEEARTAPPKISKGEHYKGLPYVMLDYPRLFSNLHVLAIRTQFWWGNYFSVTLHLKGLYRERYMGRCVAAHAELAGDGYLLALGEDEWEHEMREPWYRPIASLSPQAFAAAMDSMPFLKIGKTHGMEGDGLLESYQVLSGLL